MKEKGQFFAYVHLAFIIAGYFMLDLPSLGPRNMEPAGFLIGLWNGATLLPNAIISLFKEGVGIVEYSNTGGWYRAAFAIGAIGIPGILNWMISRPEEPTFDLSVLRK